MTRVVGGTLGRVASAELGPVRDRLGNAEVVLAGRIQLDEGQLAGLIDHAPSLDHARAHAAELLRERAGELVRTWNSA